MLEITVPATEQWDELNEQFIETKEQTLRLEHSLVSLSKWEARWNKSFLFTVDKTDEEILDYVRCMTITQNVSSEVYACLTADNLIEVDNYIKAPMTATTFKDDKGGKRNHEIITAEIIYYWMIAMNIPLECQKWHLNRLLTLIRVTSIKNAPPTKMSKREIMSQNAALNAARRKQFNTKG